MAKVGYRHVEPDGHFTFHVADGRAVTVSSKGYTTDDPGQIAYLDTVPFVKRAGKQADGDDE